MRSYTGSKIGQSDHELLSAALFSFIIHGLILTGFLLYLLAAPSKIVVPASYQVKLVSGPRQAPEETPVPPVEESKPIVPETPKKVEPVKKMAPVPKAKAEPLKQALPDLKSEKQVVPHPEEEPMQQEPAREAKKLPETSAVPQAGAPIDDVTVTASEDVPSSFYIRSVVTGNIRRVWQNIAKPPAQGAKARVSFRILRTGRVVDVKLQESSGNFYFDQAAMRTIYTANPFPVFSEELAASQYVDCSVYLVLADID